MYICHETKKTYPHNLNLWNTRTQNNMSCSYNHYAANVHHPCSGEGFHQRNRTFQRLRDAKVCEKTCVTCYQPQNKMSKMKWPAILIMPLVWTSTLPGFTSLCTLYLLWIKSRPVSSNKKESELEGRLAENILRTLYNYNRVPCRTPGEQLTFRRV